MAPVKVTRMVLDVDLKCSHCYKKVKKIMCKIPEIRDHAYDVDKNKVNITVVCCSPEKIRDKLRSSGGSSIQKIEIIVEKPEDPKPADKKEDAAKPKEKEEAPPPAKKTDPEPVAAKPAAMYPPLYHVLVYGGESYGGGYVAPPQPSGYGYGCGYGRRHGYGYSSPNICFIEENPQGCSVM